MERRFSRASVPGYAYGFCFGRRLTLPGVVITFPGSTVSTPWISAGLPEASRMVALIRWSPLFRLASRRVLEATDFPSYDQVSTGTVRGSLPAVRTSRATAIVPSEAGWPWSHSTIWQDGDELGCGFDGGEGLAEVAGGLAGAVEPGVLGVGFGAAPAGS